MKETEGRCEVLGKQQNKLQINCDNSDDAINVFFKLGQLKRAKNQGKDNTPGRIGLGHQLFKHSGELMLEEVIALINNVWRSE